MIKSIDLFQELFLKLKQVSKIIKKEIIEFRRKGFGAKLLNSAINEVKKREGNLLWCNARLIAVDFYSSLGFKTIGNEFDIKDIGLHYIMYKKIY